MMSALRAGAILRQKPCHLVTEDLDVIVLMVGFPAEVEDVLFGADGYLTAIGPGKCTKPLVVVDMSTNRPDLSRRIAERMKEVGGDALDAPVSGGHVGAQEGKLSIMVGGDRSVFDKLEESLFRCMADPAKGGNVRYMGGHGSGQQTKMCNQILIATNMIGVCEALLYAQKCDLEVEEVLKAVQTGAAGSWSLSNLGPRMLKGDYAPGFYVEHFVKDLEIALDECRRMNLALPGLALSHQLYLALKAQGHSKSGTQALYLALQALNSKN